jgi:cell pole-organizing protein PopZ
MSEQTSQEPTMEEILASIRRIISEDEAPAEGAEGPVAEPEPVPAAAEAPLPIPEPELEPEAAPAAAFTPEDEDDDSDLELTQKVETHGDLDFVAADPEPAPAFSPQPVAEEPPPAPTESLVSAHVAAAAAATFGQLSSNILMPAEGRTLEDVVREMLRPMLQQWLDANLPGIVQEAVQSEVERIARGRVR